MAKTNERKEAWFRIPLLIISGIVLYIWGVIICFLAIISWFIVVFSRKRNQDIAEFCEYFNTEMYKFFRYLTFVSNKRPFPFSNLERISRFS